MHDVTCLHTHVQGKTGKTALILACKNEHETAAAELIEATRRAGALDLQVEHAAWFGACVVWGVRSRSGGGEGCGTAEGERRRAEGRARRSEGRGGGGKGGGRGVRRH